MTQKTRHLFFDVRKLRAVSFHGFTLVELIVVITILAILATIGFLALSGYSQDAKDSAIKANVRSVQTAISSESAISNNSPRYYVVHDSWAALSGAFAYFDSVQTALSGWAWNVPGTNYSAGNPDYAKLKLNPEKFKVALNVPFDTAAAAYDPRYLAVGAVDASIPASSNGKARSAAYFQVAGISPATWTAVVSGNYPASSGSVAGLVKDPKASSSTGALIDGGNSSLPPASASNCAASTQTVNGRTYSVGAISNGATLGASSSSNVTGGTQTYSQTFACADGAVSTSGAETAGTVTCSAAGYVLIGGSCVPNSCNAIKVAYPASADGTYSIDPDGAGAGATFSALCDMTTDWGGWTLAVSIRGNSIFHLDETGTVGDASSILNAAKISDAGINAISTAGYWRFHCGTSKRAYVKNWANVWTSMRTNSQTWSMDNNKDWTFECGASRSWYVFSDYSACPTWHTDYAAMAGASEWYGCYTSVDWWGQNGTLWVK